MFKTILKKRVSLDPFSVFMVRTENVTVTLCVVRGALCVKAVCMDPEKKAQVLQLRLMAVQSNNEEGRLQNTETIDKT